MRPSWGSKAGEFHSENWAQVGYEFNPRLQIGSLLKDDLSDSTFGTGFEGGITQVVLQASL